MATVIPKMTDPTLTVKELVSKIDEMELDEFQLKIVEALLAERKRVFDVCQGVAGSCEDAAINDRDDYPRTGPAYHLRDGGVQMAAGLKETFGHLKQYHVFGKDTFPKGETL